MMMQSGNVVDVSVDVPTPRGSACPSPVPSCGSATGGELETQLDLSDDLIQGQSTN